MARLLVVALVFVAGLAQAAVAPPSADWLIEQVRALSAPEMEGRASGTPGADRAARHIEKVWRDSGLTTQLQTFDVPTGIRLGTVNAFEILAPAGRTLKLGADFTPLSVSSNGDVAAELVFAGYGITAPDLRYDDYAGVDVRDKIVLVLTGEPRAHDPASPFRRPAAYHYSERSHKIINARVHGARGVILVDHPSRGHDALPALRGISQPWDIVAMAVTRAVADALLAPANTRIAEIATAIDTNLTPRSFAVPSSRVKVTVSLVRERGTTANVIAIVPGTDSALRDETIVVGAHYDHLGRGGEGSLAPDQVGVIHPGADDNASGTAVVMGLARAFAASGGTPRTLVFAAFAGEEMGLLGSNHYVNHPLRPLERTALMINLDMIGRLRDGKLYVSGVDSGRGLRGIVEDAARGLPLTLELRGDPYAPSDHTSFYAAGRPVLFFFTGAHEDYHRPSDTWDKLNPRGLETIATLASRIIAHLGAMPAALSYVKIEAPPAAPRGGYGPFFGVIPEFGAESSSGVRITGVRPGSPAAKAGLTGGDVIVKFGGVAVKTLEDLTFALRSHRAGDRVDVVIVRDGTQRIVEATLEERR